MLNQHSSTNNPSGLLLDQFLQSRNDTTIIAPDTPTHYPDNPLHRPDVLDVAFIKICRLDYFLENLTLALSSGHTPVLQDIEERSAHSPPPKSSCITNCD